MFSSLVTQGNPMVVDTGASPVQQWNRSANLVTSVFTMASKGANWTISPLNGPATCLDGGAGTNGTGLRLMACSGAASQSWAVTANPLNGSFKIAASSTSRCMSVRGGSAAAGAVIEVDDCNAASTSQQFNVQAIYYTGTGGSSGTGSSSGTGPCAALCSNPTVLATQSYTTASLGTGAVCLQSSFPIDGYSCDNMSGRTFSVNGQTVTCGGNAAPPAMLNGGYCFQATAGGLAYADFATW